VRNNPRVPESFNPQFSRTAFSRIVPLLGLSLLLGGNLGAQSLNMVSGNGQMVSEQFISTAPLVVQAKDASGQPKPGVAVTWVIAQGSGTLHGNLPNDPNAVPGTCAFDPGNPSVNATSTTDANGLARCSLLATSLLQAASYETEVVTASSAQGNVSFFITTVITRLASGGIAPPPLVFLVTPDFDNLSLSAKSGSTLTGAVVALVAAQSGIQLGQPVPNIGLRIVNNSDPTMPPPAACNGPTGVVLTDSTGKVTCDLVIGGPPGTVQLAALVGELQITRGFNLTVTPGISCSFSLSASTQSFGANGGTGTVNVITGAGCGWVSSSNANFIQLTSGASGSGSGSVSFSVAANSGAARTGTLTIAGQTYTISQNALNPAALAITSPATLASGNVGSSYSVTLSATGGTTPYTWSLAGSLPPGLTFNQSLATISGTPTAAGTYSFTGTVTDAAAAQQSQSFTIAINSVSSGGGFTITNTSFPNGVVGQAYKQLLGVAGGCVNPFSPAPNIAVTNGALPGGLSIQVNSDSTRSIAGTPLSAGTFNFTLTATDTCAKTASASFSIVVTGTPVAAQMVANPTAIAFTILAGAADVPANQTIAITSTSTALNYSAALATATGGSWLVAKNATSGTTPGSLTLGVANFTSLAAGTYNGSITISSSASNSPVVVPVTLTVLTQATLTLSPSSFVLSQTFSSSSIVARRTIGVTSTSAVHFTVTSSTASGGNWLSVTPAQGDTPSNVLMTVDSGGLPVGSYGGLVVITPAGGTAQIVPVTLNVLPAATLQASPAPLTFSYQQGATLPGTQLLGISSTGPPLNVSLAAVTQSGGNWLLLDRTSGTTPMNLGVSVNPAGLAPGTYSGQVFVVAGDPSVVPLPIGVTLTVIQTAPNIVSVTNAASFAPGPIAPGEMVTIFGTFLGPPSLTPFQLTPAGTVSTTLAGTQVFFDTFAAAMVYTSAGQVSAIVPYEVAGRATTQVLVKYLGVASNAVTVRVIDSAPAIFVTDATGQGAIINQDNTVNSTQNGAAPLSVVSIYATGEGQTNPAGVDGSIAGSSLPLPKPLLPVTVQIGGLPAEVTYAGAAPSLPAGVFQVNARIPAGVVRGTSAAVSVAVGTASSQAGVTVAIKP
jgi:uncharacterized protein (TIGR03437 family)